MKVSQAKLIKTILVVFLLFILDLRVFKWKIIFEFDKTLLTEHVLLL